MGRDLYHFSVVLEPGYALWGFFEEMEEMLTEMMVATEMTQGEARDDIEVALLQLAFFLCAEDESFTLVDVIDPEIGTDHMDIVPFFVESDLVGM